jgi:hypothetical protein
MKVRTTAQALAGATLETHTLGHDRRRRTCRPETAREAEGQV